MRHKHFIAIAKGFVVAVLTGAIALVDERVDADVPVGILFTVPIALSAWWLGLGFGLLVAAVTMAWWTRCDIVFRPHLEVWEIAVSALLRSSVEVGIVILVHHLHRLATIDALSGVRNRQAFIGELERIIQVAALRNLSVALLFADLDNFKRVNDTLGHERGDAVLAAVGRELLHSTRHLDLVGRWGGDEFVVAAVGVNQAQLTAIAVRVETTLMALFRSLQLPDVGVSIGYALFLPPQSVKACLAAADKAMYRVKHARKADRAQSAAQGAVDTSHPQPTGVTTDL